MNTYSLEEFYKKVLKEYYEINATPEIRARVEEKKLTIKGAFDWMVSKARKINAAVTENQWAYDEMMHYFSVCNEGDTYKTDEEIKAEEERLKSEVDKRKEKAEQRRKQHAERVAKWQTLTAEQIAVEVRRTRWLKTHSWHSGKSDDEIDRLIAEEEAQEKERKAKEAEKKRKADEHAKKDAEKKAAEERRAKFQSEQLSLF